MSCPVKFSTGSSVPPRKYDLVVPMKDNEGRRIKQAVLDSFRNKMIEHFGGSTVYQATGCEKRGRNERNCEPVRVLSAVRVYELEEKPACDIWISDEKFMGRLADDVAQSFGQEGVFWFKYAITDSFSFSQSE